MAVRKIVQIDEERCNGCGQCVPSCAEGAIKVIDGKARLMADNLCDGIGNCLGTCPLDAITVIERDAEEFDEGAVEQHLQREKAPPAGGCPGSRAFHFSSPTAAAAAPDVEQGTKSASQLGHWPVKIELVPPSAPFLQNANLVVAADCAPVAYADFHHDFLRGNAVMIGCPKFSDVDDYIDRLTALFKGSSIKSITVVHMEVPCCSGLVYAVKTALERSGVKIPFIDRTISVRGEEK